MKLRRKIKFLKEIFISKNREKRKFLLAGILNVLITNLFLQIFLFLNIFNISISALLSQIINMIFGYTIYSKFIFKVRNITNINFIKKYSILMTFLWILNAYGIKAGYMIGISTNTTALLLIPFLSVVSFIIQKIWVFK